MLKAIDEISKKNDETNKLLLKFKTIDRILDKAELVSTKTDGTKFDFNSFALPLKFIEKIHNYEITLDEAIEEQTELRELINKLNDYGPRISKKKKKKQQKRKIVSESRKKLLNARDDIIDRFEKGTFPYKGSVFRTKEEESEENTLEKIKDNYNKLFKYIEDGSKDIDYNLFEDYFSFPVPSLLAKKLFETKDKKENNELVELIRVRWSNLKDKI